MEEVWKDINLASLNDQNTRPTTNHSNLGGVIFQDFLAIDPPNNTNTILSSASSESASLYRPASPAPPPPPPPPPLTALSLHFDPLTPKPSNPSSFRTFTLGTKRFPDTLPDCSLGDRRNKRMIKNRESAARSRAYTNELELKVEHLREENARLRRQQQQLSEAAATQQIKKGSLYRTSTAPF
ncbi:bZIP transcription factor 27-like [Abrus precatorius]|uniref:BZIP transcription factor 27-like n=1 Tax=Abrus precatorius TaxID=3816 RepID=A0A8B8M4Q2_ABRPR|nr:bZIP transcription factor 27-like [Abrus precatorius]